MAVLFPEFSWHYSNCKCRLLMFCSKFGVAHTALAETLLDLSQIPPSWIWSDVSLGWSGHCQALSPNPSGDSCFFSIYANLPLRYTYFVSRHWKILQSIKNHDHSVGCPNSNSICCDLGEKFQCNLGCQYITQGKEKTDILNYPSVNYLCECVSPELWGNMLGYYSLKICAVKDLSYFEWFVHNSIEFCSTSGYYWSHMHVLHND